MKKFFAFTLAETLIVMGIIGIVSALTLPNLNSSTGEKEKVAKVKKIYRDLEDSFGRAQVVYGPYEEWFFNDNSYSSQSTRFAQRMIEFMKVSKNCGLTANNGCFSKQNLKTPLGATELLDANSSRYKIILSDGTSVSFPGFVPDALYRDEYSVTVDIDGPNKGPNKMGDDIFRFRIDSGKTIVPVRMENVMYYLTGVDDGLTGYGYSASGWVIDYGNMDYLKLDSSGKCPNGEKPTEANPRCK